MADIPIIKYSQVESGLAKFGAFQKDYIIYLDFF